MLTALSQERHSPDPKPRIILLNHEWTRMNTNESKGFKNLRTVAILDTMAVIRNLVAVRNHSCLFVFIRG